MVYMYLYNLIKGLNANSVCSLMGILGTYLISTNDNRYRVIGFILYMITNVHWVRFWLKSGDKVVALQFVVFTVLAVNGVVNSL